MNYSEEVDKNHSGFNDIIVDNEPPKINPNQFRPDPNLFSQGAIELQPVDHTKLDPVIFQSKIVKWTSLILCVCCFVYLLPGAWPLVLTFIFPFIGFFAAHKYNICLIKFYSVYIILVLIVQIIVMAVLGGTAYIVFQCFIMLIEIIVLIYNLKLSSALGKLNATDRLALRSKLTNN